MSSDTVTVETFIARLREAGIELGAEAGNLRVSSLPGAFTAEIREQVTRRKRELLLYLTEHPNPEPASDACIGRASREGPLPLSFAEKGLWLVHQIYPGSAAFNWSVAVRLTGSLDIPALTRSINEIIRRHEVLRTTVTVVDDEPGRVLHSSAEMAIPLITLSEVPDAAREDELQRQVRELAGTGFDLSRGPLIRARLWRMSEREHVLLIVTHHIVSDGWSLGVIGRELEVLYRCFARDETAALPELAVQCADYAVWQREWVESEEFKHKLAFWREQLAGAPALIELPTDGPRPAARSLRGGVVSETLPPALLARLEALGRQEGATLFMMLLAAFNVLLRRYTGQDDLVVGTPVANRTHHELEPLIGFFVNLLPLRARFTGDPTFRAYLHELRASTVQAFAHQDMPFDKLVEDLHPDRTLGHTALFQVFFTLQKEWENSIQLGPDLLVTPLAIERGTSQYDLSLYAQTSRNGLRLAFEVQRGFVRAGDDFQHARAFRTVAGGNRRRSGPSPVGIAPVLRGRAASDGGALQSGAARVSARKDGGELDRGASGAAARGCGRELRRGHADLRAVGSQSAAPGPAFAAAGGRSGVTGRIVPGAGFGAGGRGVGRAQSWRGVCAARTPPSRRSVWAICWLIRGRRCW